MRELKFLEDIRPNIMIFNKDDHTYQIKDIAAAGDSRLKSERIKKLEKYTEHNREVKKTLKCRQVTISWYVH